MKGKNQLKIPIHYIKLIHQMSFRNINLNVGHHTGGKWFTYDLRPQTPQGKSVTEHAKPEALLLIILSFVCKSDIKEVHGN